MKPIIVYYPVGTVHMRNLDLLTKALPDFDFRVFYRTCQPWFSRDKVKQYPYECVFDVDDRPPPELFDGEVRALILFISAVERLITDLIEAAFIRDIPVIAIEEVVQLALNQGVINHYLMPVDHLLVASDYERDAFIKLGVLPEKITAAGWPFYSGLLSPASPERRRTLRESWHLPEDKMIAALCLSALKQPEDPSSLETLAVRWQLLSLVKQGLPPDYHVVVKLHPTEDVASARQVITPYLPDATIIGGATGIGEVLDGADVCLNRGNSQVVLEALLRGIPVLVLPCGIPTLFDNLADNVVMRSPEELSQALHHLSKGGEFDYEPIMKTHFPWKPEEALQRTAERLREIADSHILTRREEDWLDLAIYRGFLGDSQAGIGLLLSKILSQKSNYLSDTLIRLLNMRATLSDIEFLLSEINRPYQKPLLLSLWIRQLYHSKHRINNRELAVIPQVDNYPPQINPHDYLPYVIMLGQIYLRSGDVESAGHLCSRFEEQFGLFERFRELEAKVDLARRRINGNVVRYLWKKGKSGMVTPLRYFLHLARRFV
ncbi:hypothetical protein ACFLWY_00870 [Chloroflexota bacterium]